MSDVFQAISDSTRRSMLDRLMAEGALSVTEFAGPLEMTRQAVTKHLDLLIAAGLVRAEKIGRERRHHLVRDAIAPAARWIEQHEKAWDRRLQRLADFLQAEEINDSPTSGKRSEP